MTWNEVFPLAVVRQNSLQIYQVEASGWGNFGAAATPNSLASPRLATPLYGVAIDPDSDFDRANLVPSVDPGTPSSLSRDRLPIVRDSMLAGRFSFPRIKTYDGGFFLQCPADLRYGDTYTDTDGVSRPFGSALNALVNGIFQIPSLRAIIYIDALTAPPSLPKRPPRNHTRIAEHIDAAVPFLVVPTFGRKSARVTGLYTGADNPHVITINGVAPFPNIAFPRTTMNLVPNASQSVLLTDLACNFLVIKSEIDINPNSLTIQVQTRDD